MIEKLKYFNNHNNYYFQFKDNDWGRKSVCCF